MVNEKSDSRYFHRYQKCQINFRKTPNIFFKITYSSTLNFAPLSFILVKHFEIFFESYAIHLYKKQINHNHSSLGDSNGVRESRKRMDYSYIEYLHKAMVIAPDASVKMDTFHQIKFHEGFRDYYSSSLRQINHLIQLDEKPNLELKEPRWEIFKISLSFPTRCKLNRKKTLNYCINNLFDSENWGSK